MARTSLLVVAIALLVPVTAPASAHHEEDGLYRIPAWFTWHTATLNVLVVPPNHGYVFERPIVDPVERVRNLVGDPSELNPYTNTYTQATLAAIEAWRGAVDQLGAAWLRDALELRVYVVGAEEIPPEALAEPHIVVTALEEANGIWGGAATTTRGSEGDRGPCVVSVTKVFLDGSWSYREFFNLMLHEVGHCLGLLHTSEDPEPETFHPEEDPMSYGPLWKPRCPSNLNVRGLEFVFGGLVGFPSGGVATVPVDEYAQAAC